MNPQATRSDTNAWILQVWISFFVAIGATSLGIYHLPVENVWVRAFMSAGFLFMIASTFTLAKTIRDNRLRTIDTSAWMLQVWLAFGLAVLLMIFGVYNLPVTLWVRGYMSMGLLFSVGSTFTLAKTVRDNDELKKAGRIQPEARRETPPPSFIRPTETSSERTGS